MIKNHRFFILHKLLSFYHISFVSCGSFPSLPRKGEVKLGYINIPPPFPLFSTSPYSPPAFLCGFLYFHPGQKTISVLFYPSGCAKQRAQKFLPYFAHLAGIYGISHIFLSVISDHMCFPALSADRHRVCFCTFLSTA